MNAELGAETCIFWFGGGGRALKGRLEMSPIRTSARQPVKNNSALDRLVNADMSLVSISARSVGVADSYKSLEREMGTRQQRPSGRR